MDGSVYFCLITTQELVPESVCVWNPFCEKGHDDIVYVFPSLFPKNRIDFSSMN